MINGQRKSSSAEATIRKYPYIAHWVDEYLTRQIQQIQEVEGIKPTLGDLLTRIAKADIDLTHYGLSKYKLRKKPVAVAS